MSAFVKHKKKKFNAKRMKCAFCQKNGHESRFCPLTPTKAKGAEKCGWAEKLTALPVVEVSFYNDMSWEQAIDALLALGEACNAGNPWSASEKPVDTLRRNLGYWKAIGASKAVLSWIVYGLEMWFEREPPRRFFRNNKSCEENADFLEKELRENVLEGRFEICSPRDLWVCNPLGAAVNKKGKQRCVHDFRYVNAYQASPHFKMVSMKSELPSVAAPGEILLTKDLKGAFYRLIFKSQSRKYTGFHWRGIFYKALAMIFGWCNSPVHFTKVVRPIVRFFGAIEAACLNWADDFLWSTEDRLLARLHRLIDAVFSRLGWQFSEKGEEGTRVDFLGFVIDNCARMYFVQKDKAERAIAVMRHLEEVRLVNQKVKKKDLQRLTGSLNSMTTAIPEIRAWTRALYAIGGGNGETCLEEEQGEELRMLISLLMENRGHPFMDARWEADIYVDTSETGWGAMINGEKWRGWLDASLIGTSSTMRELEGVLCLLHVEKIAELIRGKWIRLTMDSSAGIANLMKGGGPVPELCRVIKLISLRMRELDVKARFKWRSRDK